MTFTSFCSVRTYMKLLVISLFSVLTIFSSSVFALEKVILQLEWKHQFEFAGFYAAKAQGYYQQAGLDVDIKERNETTDMLQDVLTGKATYGVASAQIIIDRVNNYPVVLLASYFKQNALALVTHSSIKTPHDLIGKRVMIGRGDLRKTAVGLLLQEKNVPVDRITQVPHGFNAQDFIDGKVDAMSVFVSNELFEIEQSGIAYNLINPAEYGIYSLDVNLFSSENEVDNNPDRVRRFLEASKKGWQYALAHQEEIVDLILKGYSNRKSKAALLFEAQKTEELIKPELYEIGSISPEIVEFTKNRYSRLNALPNKSLGKKFIFSGTQSNPIELTEEEQQYLDQKQQLTMCVDPDWMPYEKIENGKHVGMSADFIKLFSKKINIPITLIPSNTWMESLVLGKQRKCDIFSLVMATPDREKFLDFTQPYLTFPLVIATRHEQIYIPDIESILDKKLGIQKGYAYAELLRLQYPEINLIEVDSLEAGLDLVNKKQLFGMVGSLPSVAYAFQKSYVGELKIAGKLDQMWQLGVGTRNDEPLLMSVFNKAINRMSENERQDITNRWIAISYELGTDYTMLIRVLAVISVIFCIFIYYHLKLKKYNRILEHQSVTDKLTGIFNRIKLDYQLEHSLDLAVRYKQAFSIILLDIDYFKHVNDDYGHLVGDYGLKEVAKLLQDNIRSVDTLGRWGGEEFLIICPEQSRESAAILAEKLREVIGNYKFNHFSHLTCSFGVSCYQVHDNSHQIIKRADDALYKAKDLGRNKVCIG